MRSSSVETPGCRLMSIVNKEKTMQKLFTKAVLDALLKNGKANNEKRNDPANLNGETIDFKPVVKIFSPVGGATWLLTELDPEDQDTAFGLCDLGLGCPELGNVSIGELARIRVSLPRMIMGRMVMQSSRQLPLERDMHFRAKKTLQEYADDARKHQRIRA